MNGRSPPERQNSAVSTTSPGGRTVTARSTRRRSSASNNHSISSSGLFARLTGKQTTTSSPSSSSTASTSPTPVYSASDDGVRDASIGAIDDRDRERRGNVADLEDVSGGGATDQVDQAGPSDYWRRTPSPPSSPPAGWRMESTEVWGNDEDGPSDTWRPHDSPVNGRVTPSFRTSSPAHILHTQTILTPPEQGLSVQISRPVDHNSSTRDGTGNTDYFNQKHGDSPTIPQSSGVGGDADIESQQDIREYESRMRDVFVDTNTETNTPTPTSGFSPAGSVSSLRVGHQRGTKSRGYDAEYKEIIGEKAGKGEEEFGSLKFPQRVSLLSTRCGRGFSRRGED